MVERLSFVTCFLRSLLEQTVGVLDRARFGERSEKTTAADVAADVCVTLGRVERIDECRIV